MENQHKKINGYRDLSAEEIALMNEVKAKAEEVRELINSIVKMRTSKVIIFPDKGEEENKLSKESQRCAAIASDNLQTGFMWLVRSVALPESF